MKQPIYLDYAATTPMDARVVAKMQEALSHPYGFGNASSSTHCYGISAYNAIMLAREQVADLIAAEPAEIIWTSGATESINLALKGATALYQRKGKHIVTLTTEHKAVLDCCEYLIKQGYSVTYLSPDRDGVLDKDKFCAALQEDTVLVSIAHANNEIGAIQNIAALAEMTAARGILLHVDAAQSVGKIPINVQTMAVDLMSLSAHKIYGPKGVGALYVRKKPRVRVAPLIAGGGQEQGMRSGTLPTHQIVGMGEAYTVAKHEMTRDYDNAIFLRQILLTGLKKSQNIRINNDINYALPNLINAQFIDFPAQDFIAKMQDHMAVSAGSACLSKGSEPSYVLRAIGLSEWAARCSIRLSWGRFTTEAQMHKVIDCMMSIDNFIEGAKCAAK